MAHRTAAKRIVRQHRYDGTDIVAPDGNGGSRSMIVSVNRTVAGVNPVNKIRLGSGWAAALDQNL
jgi:hypothetical protein